VHPNQQLRALQEIHRNPPPVVFAWMEPTHPEGSALPLRTHLLYRYVAQNYIPFTLGRFTMMVRPDQRDRVTQLATQPRNDEFPSDAVLANTSEIRLSLLDKIFRVTNLGSIPSSWGRSMNSLQSRLEPRQTISTQIQPALQGIKALGGDRYEVTGDKPALTYDLSTLNVQGRDAGLLGFQFACQQKSKTRVGISWQVKGNPQPTSVTQFEMMLKKGPQLVPLDIFPRWLFGKDIQSLQFELFDPNSCQKFTLSDLKLYQRIEVAQDLHNLFSQNSLP